MRFSRIYPFLAAGWLLLLGACQSRENTGSGDVDPRRIFLDYRVTGDNEMEFVTATLQFRVGGEHGPALVLEEPSQVQFDGVVLPVDSARFNGAFYEIRLPRAEFAGKHTIIFTDINNKEYREEFEFPILTLENDFPAKISKADSLLLQWNGVPAYFTMTLLATDTSFRNQGVDRLDTLQDGKLTIPAGVLAPLSNGPAQFEFYWDSTRALSAPTEQGGRISLSFAVRKYAELID